ncbi:uncharacterized protein LOC118798379 [Colossoma macropomum]|uniref:uncharacterized protein LOC118798379 n=1 Tax=Colossoma macropomum TaxID=42526 RepID=UPI00186514FF|nr:uncharacterized protein LOC118798379 [Colossoma macropomum]
MRGNISRALILSALWIGCCSVLVSAQCNSTELISNATTTKPCSLYNGTTTNSTSTNFTTTNFTQVTCSPGNMTYASSWGETPSTGDIASMTGALESLSPENLKSVEFIQMWVCIRLLPLLPVINDTFMSELSKKEFTCESYQEIVKGLSLQITLMRTDLRKSIYTNFILPFLTRNSGCVSGNMSSGTWLKSNFGNFSTFAKLQYLKKINGNFSAEEVLESLSAQQKAELILDPSSGALENETLVKEVLTGILSSSGKEQLYVFFETFVNVTEEVSSTCL